MQAHAQVLQAQAEAEAQAYTCTRQDCAAHCNQAGGRDDGTRAAARVVAREVGALLWEEHTRQREQAPTQVLTQWRTDVLMQLLNEQEQPISTVGAGGENGCIS